MPDFTSISPDKIDKILNKFDQDIHNLLDNIRNVMVICEKNTLSSDILDEAISLQRGEKSLADILAKKLESQGKPMLNLHSNISPNIYFGTPAKVLQVFHADDAIYAGVDYWARDAIDWPGSPTNLAKRQYVVEYHIAWGIGGIWHIAEEYNKDFKKARIIMSAKSPLALDNICHQVEGIAETTGICMKGPVLLLPTKRMTVPYRYSKRPDEEGTATFDHEDMRVHKRLIDLDADERALRQLMKIQIPKDVNIQILGKK